METARLQRTTSSGAVSGLHDDEALAFLGIPYAAPPVGAARLTEPRPPVPWSGVREATSFGPVAPQTALPGMAASTTAASGDEWLTVNVWTPREMPAAPLPVMVWVHGGAFVRGASSEPDLRGRRLAAEGVVVVTVNYRLGIEGFAHIAGAPANRGLLDVVAALEWVRENVAEFDGDPGRVTVFGQSAGALIVSSLLAMPRARGLFRRAIVQSTPGTVIGEPLAADIGAHLLERLGREASAAGVRATDPRELASALAPVLGELRDQRARWGSLALGMPFAPVLDGDVLPRTPWEALAAGEGRAVDLVVGHTRDESRLALVLSGRAGAVTEAELDEALRDHAPEPAGAEAYRAAYPDADAETLSVTVQSDATFRMPSIQLADAQSIGGGRVFAYELVWATPRFGACHCADYGLVFGERAGLTALLTDGVDDAEFEGVSARLRRQWAAFAGKGDPGWAPYDPADRLVQVVDRECRVVPYPEEASRRLWERQPPPRVLALRETAGGRR